MSQMIFSFRTATSGELAEALHDARDYTLTLFDCLAAAGLDFPEKVPRLPYINPPLWELGHIAWFAEWYILREADSSNPSAAQRTSTWRLIPICRDRRWRRHGHLRKESR